MIGDLIKRIFFSRPGGASSTRPSSGAAAAPTARPANASRTSDEEARALWEGRLAHDPLDPRAHAALAEIDMRAGNTDAAIAHYLTVAARHPDEPEILTNLGALYVASGQYAEAVVRLERALTRSPGLRPARYHLSRALLEQRRFAEVEPHMRALLADEPESVATHLRLAYTLLMQGKLDEGWREYEWRLRGPGFEWGRRRLPAWEGGDPAGRAIRVIAEQGLGDAMLFARYVPRLTARGARVQLLVRPPLARLFDASFASPAVRVTDDRMDVAGLDSYVHLASLPVHLALGELAVARVPRYLRAPDEARARWHPRIAALPGPRIGLVWSGNPERVGDDSRSIAPALLAPLAAAVPGASWVSLQASISAAAPRPFAFAADPMSEVSDFADTAAIIEALDLVVSVDTSVAHAAAALGRSVILLAPHNVCWRWDMAGEASPWYPGVQVFRAPGLREWQPVVREAAGVLSALAASRV
jgi:tetratricopeptide (TPR) repeat protein